MNIVKLIYQYIRLKIYLKIAKNNLRVIKYLGEQKARLNEIMTTYEVEDNLVELKKPNYDYYIAHNSIDVNSALKNIVFKKDINMQENNIKYIKNQFEINEEGYYCIVTKREEVFALINGEIHPLEFLADGLPFKEILDSDIPVEDGYYKRYKVSKKYFYAENKLNVNKIDIKDIEDKDIPNIKFVDDINKINKEGYYKVLV